MPTDGTENPDVQPADPDTQPADAGTEDPGARPPNPVTADLDGTEASAGTGDAAAQRDGSTGRIPLDLVGGLFLLAVVAFFLIRAGDDPLDWVFPRTLSYLLAIIGVYLTIRGLLGAGDRTDTLLPILRGRGIDVFVFTVLTAVYVVLARPVGFWIMSSLTLFAGSVYLDHERTPKRIAVAAAVAVLVCVFAFLLLERVFYVPVPKARWLWG